MKGQYSIKTDTALMDMNFIQDYLSKVAYWSKGRSLEAIEKSMGNSLCFGVFTEEGEQIAFARIITDHVVFAWIMDVFVKETLRGKGIGTFLLEHIVNHPDLKTVNGIGLRTNDAHGLYRKFGFGDIPNPHTWMFKSNKKQA